MAREFVGQEYMAATRGKGLQEDSHATRVLTHITVTSSVLITLISIAMIGFCIFFAICPVIGTSMMTTLNATGKNTDSAITCILGDPHHGDIVVSKLYIKNTYNRHYLQEAAKGDRIAANNIESLKKIYSESDKDGNYMFIVKRLIGMPGDKISMTRSGDNYYIYVNGELLEENYLDPQVAYRNARNFKQLWNVLNNSVWKKDPSRIEGAPDGIKDGTIADISDWVTYNYSDCVLNHPNEYKTSANADNVSEYMLVVPNNAYFLMGDNRGGEEEEYSYSWDSSYFGPLPQASYVSRCVDVVNSDISMPGYLWKKFCYYISFAWLREK